jgi:hypothetical protein
MIAPAAPQLAEGGMTNAVFIALLALGAFLSFKGYGPPGKP